MSLFSLRRPASINRRLRLDPMESRVNPSHTVDITAPALTGPEGTAVEFTSTVTGATTPTYEWTVTRDGNPFATGTTPDFTFTPDDNGNYVVMLNVTDTETAGDGTTTTHTITDTETFVADERGPDGHYHRSVGHGAGDAELVQPRGDGSVLRGPGGRVHVRDRLGRERQRGSDGAPRRADDRHPHVPDHRRQYGDRSPRPTRTTGPATRPRLPSRSRPRP